jgi:hypothetical protein
LVRCILSRRALSISIFSDKSQLVVAPTKIIIVVRILLLNGINKGITWIGITHNMIDPAITDINDIVNIGINVE